MACKIAEKSIDMTQEQILGTKAILKFTGTLVEPIADTYRTVGKWTNITEFRYHEDWNMLMAVVEKIAKTKYKEDNSDGFDPNDYPYPRTFGMLSENGNVMVRFNRCPVFEAPTLIGATYAAVLDFIKYYNSTK